MLEMGRQQDLWINSTREIRERFADFSGRTMFSPMSRSAQPESEDVVGQCGSPQKEVGDAGLLPSPVMVLQAGWWAGLGRMEEASGPRAGPSPSPGEGAASRVRPGGQHPRSPPAPGRKGYDWCLDKCFLFDFLILVFSEKALASSNSFLRVAGAERPVSRRAGPRMGAGGGATGKRWGGGRREGEGGGGRREGEGGEQHQEGRGCTWP